MFREPSPLAIFRDKQMLGALCFTNTGSSILYLNWTVFKTPFSAIRLCIPCNSILPEVVICDYKLALACHVPLFP